MKWWSALQVLVLGGSMTLGASAAPVITGEEWARYLEAYVSPEGRVIDTANGMISHSESQGYGLVLAALADDPAGFERILKFTRDELMIRKDGLAAWRWEPDADPHVTDMNNATDGDMLIAYGLLLAGKAWDKPDYTEAATTLARTIGHDLLALADGMPALLPGREGFAGSDETANQPVLNPSYWIFEVLPRFSELDPVTDWEAVSETGLEILRRAAGTTAGIPGDWVVMAGGDIGPAPGFPAEFSYNGIRIPLYLMRAGLDASYLDPFRAKASSAGLFKIELSTGAATETIGEPGYRLIQAAMECVATGRAVPEQLQKLETTSYYAATLQLLMLDHLRRHQPDCLAEGDKQ